MLVKDYKIPNHESVSRNMYGSMNQARVFRWSSNSVESKETWSREYEHSMLFLTWVENVRRALGPFLRIDTTRWLHLQLMKDVSSISSLFTNKASASACTILALSRTRMEERPRQLEIWGQILTISANCILSAWANATSSGWFIKGM